MRKQNRLSALKTLNTTLCLVSLALLGYSVTPEMEEEINAKKDYLAMSPATAAKLEGQDALQRLSRPLRWA